MFTSVGDRIRIQLQLFTSFLRREGQFWVLEGFWMQVGILTGNSASTCDFNCSREHIGVSNSSLCCFMT